jgi:predicted CopG family antitoxin
MAKVVKITDEAYAKLKAISKHQRRNFKTILSRAIENLYVISVGSQLKKG